ncbi:MAG: triose-phosphate isomerase [bacterium]|nr:triose-phosphate isomerase [bacterium]
MNKRGRLVVANWKMYIESPEEAKKFASSLRRKSRLFSGVGVVLAPAFTLVPIVAAALKGSNIRVAGQTVAPFDDVQGKAHTGSVSADMLKKIGATYVIVGHSERRAHSTGSGQAGETNEIIRAQLAVASNAGLTAILCVGEQERDAGGAYFSIIEQQINSALKGFPKIEAGRLVIAYEPVWAIGKNAGDAMRPQDLREMSIFIKKTLADIFERKAALRVPILYGGSVEPNNAHALITDGDVAGFLVGHASAELDSFIEILKSCKK